MEDSQKVRGSRQLKMVCKNFVDKCPPAVLDVLLDKTYKDFFSFLRSQKRIDDEKNHKLSSLVDEWRESNKKEKDWKSALTQYFEHDKNRNKKSW